MAIYLDEDMVGADRNVIAYPHLLLCMGITLLMDDGSLIGAHATNKSTETALLAELGAQIASHGGNMNHLYCTGNYDRHKAHGGLSVRQKANTLGFHGQAYLFDTSTIKPKDGTFVQITSNGPNQKCAIEDKRDEKVKGLYQRGGGVPVSKIYAPSYRYPNARMEPESTFTVGLTGPIHKLHVADFCLQVKRYDIP